jgi:hypothetical protein
MAHGNKGKKFSKEHKKNISKSLKGRRAWNKGLSKENDERIKKQAEALRNSDKHWSRSSDAEKIKKEHSKKMSGRKLSKERREQISHTSSGVNNGMYDRTHSKEAKSKMSNAAKKNWANEEFREKQKKSHWSKGKNSENIGNKISETKARLISEGKLNYPANHGYKFGYYVSQKMNEEFYYRSSYELIRFTQLEQDESVIKYTIKHGLRFPYKYKGKIKHYVPDILIEYSNGEIVLEEIKGWVRNQKMFELKCEAAEKYCRENNITYKVVYKEGL